MDNYLKNGIVYQLSSNGRAVVQGLADLNLRFVQIEEEVCGHKVTKIKKNAFKDTLVEEVVVGSNVFIIEEMAFAHCKELKGVRILGEEVYLKHCAFINCHKLLTFSAQKIHVSSSVFERNISLCDFQGVVMKANKYAFSECANLNTLTFQDLCDGIHFLAFHHSGIKKLIFYGELMRQQDYSILRDKEIVCNPDSSIQSLAYLGFDIQVLKGTVC